MMEELLKELFKAHIKEANAIYRIAQNYQMTNTQEFLDWQDSLNEVSVR